MDSSKKRNDSLSIEKNPLWNNFIFYLYYLNEIKKNVY